MRILTVAFFDDNYGDMLIRTCFLQLAKVVLKNLNISGFELDVMPLKSPDDEQVRAADLIVFPGGAMFGVNYLGVADYIERVLNIADERGIPVIFSSLGLNHMESHSENDDRLRRILSRPCIKAVSVRDSEEIFRAYAGKQSYEILPVCDPVMWCESVYSRDVAAAYGKKRERKTPLVGLNVVRGGLFKANGIDWTLTKEEEYLCELSKLLDAKGIDYRFFTNGSTWDINTLKHFKDKYGISPDKLVYCDTSREVVQAEAAFDAVIAIRMHSAIIAYGLGIPSINYVWNPKIPYLYEKIGCPQRAVSPADWSAERAAELLDDMLSEKNYRPKPELLMTLYGFLFDSFRDVLGADKGIEMYDFAAVDAQLRGMTVPESEDYTDLRTKLKRGENRYYTLFKSDDRKRLEVARLGKDLNKAEEECERLKAKQAELEAANKTLSGKLERQKKELNAVKAEREKAQLELDRINSKFIIRAYRKVKRTFSAKSK